MAPNAHGPDEWVRELFDRVQPVEPPTVSLDTIVAEWRQRRRRWVAAGVGVAASIALLLMVALGGSEPEPPVHLDILIVDVPEAPDDDVDTAAWYSMPEEARNP